MLQVAWPESAGMSLVFSFQFQSLRCKPHNGELPASTGTPTQGGCSPIMRVCSCEPGLYGCLAPIILWRPCAAHNTHILAKSYARSATRHLTAKSIVHWHTGRMCMTGPAICWRLCLSAAPHEHAGLDVSAHQCSGCLHPVTAAPLMLLLRLLPARVCHQPWPALHAQHPQSCQQQPGVPQSCWQPASSPSWGTAEGPAP